MSDVSSQVNQIISSGEKLLAAPDLITEELANAFISDLASYLTLVDSLAKSLTVSAPTGVTVEPADGQFRQAEDPSIPVCSGHSRIAVAESHAHPMLRSARCAGRSGAARCAGRSDAPPMPFSLPGLPFRRGCAAPRCRHTV